jgi:hypothetical protein
MGPPHLQKEVVSFTGEEMMSFLKEGNSCAGSGSSLVPVHWLTARWETDFQPGMSYVN